MTINFASKAEIMEKECLLPEEEGEKELCHILTNGSWEDISKLFKWFFINQSTFQTVKGSSQGGWTTQD